jgi:nitrogen fixation/metabolism regulation signal transduction histidine kinase
MVPATNAGLVEALVDAYPAATMLVDEDVRVEHLNESARQLLGSVTSLNRRGGELLHCVHAGVADGAPGSCGEAKACEDCVVRGSVAAALDSGAVRRRRAFMQLNGKQGVTELYLLVSAAPLQVDERKLCIVTLEDVTELVNLRSVVALCAHCNRVRSGQGGDWQRLEAFLKERLDLDCSHSICEECLDRYFPEPTSG